MVAVGVGVCWADVRVGVLRNCLAGSTWLGVGRASRSDRCSVLAGGFCCWGLFVILNLVQNDRVGCWGRVGGYTAPAFGSLALLGRQ